MRFVDSLARLVSSGDWVIDIGANVGAYAYRLSELVGSTGRVFAFEPVPETMSLLAANLLRSPHQNVTLLNMAASDSTAVVRMNMPEFSSGLSNFYRASPHSTYTRIYLTWKSLR